MLQFHDHRVLVIAPHPDDEVFGCGGLIHRVKREGGQVYILYLTVGGTQDFSTPGHSTQDERLAELARVVRRLRIDGYRIAFPGDAHHLKLDAMPQKDLIHTIERGPEVSLESLKPSIVITTTAEDYNQDHRAAHTATMAATRPASPEVKSFQPLVLTFGHPTDGWSVGVTPSAKTFFVRLTEEDLQAKVEALKLYRSQLKHPDNPLSVLAVEIAARLNGLQCGGGLAEAFGIKRFVL